MSVTSIINYTNKQYKEFRTLLEDLFPTPKFGSKDSIKVEPITKNFALIGSAFDYLLRFTLEKRFKGFVYGSPWVAETALNRFKGSSIVTNFNPIDMDIDAFMQLQEKQEELNQFVNSKFKECKKLYDDYVNSNINVSDALLEACLFFGILDLYVRTIRFDNEIITKPTSFDDIKDLRLLLENCNLDYFTPKKKIVLNPTFGEGSVLVGGADADLIIDNTLIDIKVTKDLKITRQIYNQLICYYLIYLIGGVEKHEDVRIENLGIYFARYNSLWTIPIKEVGSKEHFEEAIIRLKTKK
jgi:hypothetical protein